MSVWSVISPPVTAAWLAVASHSRRNSSLREAAASDEEQLPTSGSSSSARDRAAEGQTRQAQGPIMEGLGSGSAAPAKGLEAQLRPRPARTGLPSGRT